jgi:predicted transcriptional regulator
MDNLEILSWCEQHLSENEVIDFPDEIFGNLTVENSKLLVEIFGKHTFMKLPLQEKKFFEWLKENDKKVWDDLWKSEEEVYVVALNFLPLLIDKNSRGFPICDLMENDNYYFMEQHLVDHDSKLMIDSVQEMYRNHKPLTVEQTLVLEISLHPIDIWHFAYRYNINIDRAKQAINNLVEEKIIVHLKEAEYLATFIDF